MTLSKQNVKTFFLSTLIALSIKWVPRLKDVLITSLIKDERKLAFWMLKTEMKQWKHLNARKKNKVITVL